jgi:hypothetical protein
MFTLVTLEAVLEVNRRPDQATIILPTFNIKQDTTEEKR